MEKKAKRLQFKMNQMNKIKHQYIGLVYISPWIIGFCIFHFYPFIASLVYSFTDYSLLKEPNFIGFDNYINMFTRDPLFWKSFRVTLLYVLIAVPSKLIFALIIAIILNMKLKFVNFFRTVFYLPSILGGSVAIAILWRFLFMHDGLVNNFLNKFSIPAIDWLGNPNIALYSIALLTVWQFGSSMVIFLAGLKQIPKNLYEAAEVDGASKLRQFFSVTLPLLTPMIFFNLIMQLVYAFQEFTAAFVITKGGPLRSTYLYGMMLYENGFQFFKMGYASAQSWFLFIIMMTLTLIIFKTSKSWTYYDDGGEF